MPAKMLLIMLLLWTIGAFLGGMVEQRGPSDIWEGPDGGKTVWEIISHPTPSDMVEVKMIGGVIPVFQPSEEFFGAVGACVTWDFSIFDTSVGSIIKTLFFCYSGVTMLVALVAIVRGV